MKGNTNARAVVVRVDGKTVKTSKGAKQEKTYTIPGQPNLDKVTVYVAGKKVITLKPKAKAKAATATRVT